MPFLLRHILLLACIGFVGGCATTEPAWRDVSRQAMQQLEAEGVQAALPDAFRSMQQVFEQGELVLRDHQNVARADQLYQLAFQKGELLKAELQHQRTLQALQAEAAARLKAEQERQRLEDERRRRLLAEEQQRMREQEERERKAAQAELNLAALQRPASYSVRRGETLPQIAGRPEIYNEAGLWPLIYRANRDQVRDPYQLWPGQVLKIPRNYSREEATEARRQSARR